MTPHPPEISSKANFNFLLPKSVVIGTLAAIYILAYIITPYWFMPASNSGITAALILTIGIGAIWSYFSADDLRVNINIPSLLFLFLLIAGVFALNFQALRYDLPWKGDEEAHINKTLWIIDFISPKWLITYFAILFVFLWLAWKKPKWAAVFGSFMVGLLIITCLRLNLIPKLPELFLRYPFVNYLLYSILPTLISPAFPYHEILFRVIPALATGLLVWTALKKLNSMMAAEKLLWGIAFATIPLVFYYSSILYLELPAAFLMLVVSLNISSLLNVSFKQIRKIPAWYALILVGFIKETTISFLFCFLFSRMAIFLFKKFSIGKQNREEIKQIVREFLSNEALILGLSLIPLLFYLSMRTIFTDTRSFSPNISNLLVPAVYPTLVHSFLDQFGIFLLLFLSGCVLLALEKDFLVLFFYLLVFLFIPLFHVVDAVEFTGYSRFNLFVSPIIIAGASITIKKISEYKRMFSILAACIVLAVNIWLSPVYPDGSKKALWGSYLSDTAEHYYPYQETLVWLEDAHRESRILFVTNNYSYSFEFYFNQLHWRPNSDFWEHIDLQKGLEINALSIILNKAGAGGFDVVSYMVAEKDTVLPQNSEGYHLEKVFKNDDGNVLAIYVK